MPSYPDKVLEIINRVCSHLDNHGWHTDMAIDFGSQARCEARIDSDFDISLYIHHDNLIQLFSEYRRRICEPSDEAYLWHRKIMGHLPGFIGATGDLEGDIQGKVAEETDLPVNIVHIYDTRLVLLNLAYETWPVFELVCGKPLFPSSFHDSLMAALQLIRPFHRRFADIHLDQCVRAKLQAEAGLSRISADDGAATQEEHKHWLSSVLTYLRNLLALRGMLIDGRFIADRKDICRYARNIYPDRYDILDLLYQTKCQAEPHDRYLRTGLTAGLTAAQLLEGCGSLGDEIRKSITDYMGSVSEAEIDEERLFQMNLERFRTCQFYADLVPVP